MARGYKAEHPCSLCGQPTKSKLPVCYRPGECRNEAKRLAKAAVRGKVALQRHPCSICGRPTSSKFEMCCRPGRCETEYMRQIPKPARTTARTSHPCSLCGRPTISKLPMCCRAGNCQIQYARLAVRIFKDRHRPEPRPGRVLNTHPCALCGLPTTSKFPVCQRPGKCRTEYTRLQTRASRGTPLVPKRVPATKEQRLEIQRERRKAQRGAPSVYAVWFPVPCVLKVGFTEHTRDSLFESSARTRAVRRGWNVDGYSCIWKRPGDTRTEAWMQATLAFRWLPAFDQKFSRICEWFVVPGVTAAQVTEILDEFYELVPVDLAGSVEAVPELVSAGSQMAMF